MSLRLRSSFVAKGKIQFVTRSGWSGSSCACLFYYEYDVAKYVCPHVDAGGSSSRLTGRCASLVLVSVQASWVASNRYCSKSAGMCAPCPIEPPHPYNTRVCTRTRRRRTHFDAFEDIADGHVAIFAIVLHRHGNIWRGRLHERTGPVCVLGGGGHQMHMLMYTTQEQIGFVRPNMSSVFVCMEP